MSEITLQGVGFVRIPSTGEMVGQYGYELTAERGAVLPSGLQIDVPVAMAVRCKVSGLSMEVELEDGRQVVFVVSDVGPGGADVTVIGVRLQG